MRTLVRCLLVIFGMLAALPLRPVAAEASLATWYGPGFDGSLMANGQVYNMHDPTTTASNLYPLGTWLKVTNLQNGREAVPVNPAGGQIEGLEAYPDLAAVPGDIDGVSIITPPAVTEKVVEQALARGVRQIWMQPGAESATAIAVAEQAGANVIAGGPCILVTLRYRERSA